jgi:hypothetical protein
MAPAAAAAPIGRLVGNVVFVLWCMVVAVALSALSLVHLGRLAAGWSREAEPFGS